MSKKLLIFGARKKSIGHAVSKTWMDMFGDSVVTVGVSGEENIVGSWDAEEGSDFSYRSILEREKPDRVLVTIGANDIQERGETFYEHMGRHFTANVIIPMDILRIWKEVGPNPHSHFVAVSSNSAHIPRSNSMAYCSSKAALSMAIRCAARDEQKEEGGLSIYGWEPGLVKGTPMSGERGGTRMLGLPEGISRRALATQIVATMAFGGTEYSGNLIRVDNGEV